MTFCEVTEAAGGEARLVALLVTDDVMTWQSENQYIADPVPLRRQLIGAM